jgi:ABC-type polysaccharide/polyol phosphate transport system ATPase subunit
MFLLNKNSNDFAINVNSVSKTFKIYENPVLGPLKVLLFPWKRKKYYREFKALNNLTFSIRRGEVVGIIGPNGSGKTTLLKMIAGLLPVNDGSITIKGKITALLALGVGVHSEFSGRENIFFSGLLLGMSANEIESKSEDIIKFSEIGDFIDQPFRTYSSGMKARLLFSISMSVSPDIMIVDEALATGDIGFVRKCEARIKELCSSGATILFVSHNMMQINSLCSRSILLLNGNILADGSPLDVFDRYKELYLKQQNFKSAEVHKNKLIGMTSGNGEVELTSVIFRGVDDQPTNLFLTGSPMTIDLGFKQNKQRKPYHVFIGFMLGSQYVGHIDTEALLTDLGLINYSVSDCSSLKIFIDRLVLLNGEFSLWVTLIDPETREVISEYRNLGHFSVAKPHYPFDLDSYFMQPVKKIMVQK